MDPKYDEARANSVGSKATLAWAVSLAALVAGAAVHVLRATRGGGELVFPLDDPYIHMAIARSLAEHRVWGVTPDAFSASSSSVLWPLLLAAGFVMTGPTALWPLVLNVLAAMGVLLLGERWLRQTGLHPVGRGLALLLLACIVSCAAPLGMEHTLHAFAALLLLQRASQVLSTGASSSLGLGTCAAFATALRYESLLFAGLLALCLFARRRLRPALAVSLGGLLPVVTFGAWSLAHGWELWPNPITQKRAAFGWETGTLRLSLNVASSPGLLLAAVVLLGLACHEWRRSRSRATLLALVLLSICGHLGFAATDALARYETYLSVLAVVSLSVPVARAFEGSRGHWTFVHALLGGGLFGVVLLLITRIVGVWSLLPMASRNIRDQQMQTARFVRSLPPGVRVAVNDIGAVALYGEHDIFDLWGLASLPPTRYRAALASAGSMRNLAHAQGARIAVAYAHAFAPSRRDAPAWRDLGQLTIADNVTCAHATVHFYAADDESSRIVRTALEGLLPTLPARTRWSDQSLHPLANSGR